MKRNIGRWTAREIPREMSNGRLKENRARQDRPRTQATPREVLKRNAKLVSKRESSETGPPENSSDATRGLENTRHSRVSEATPHKGLIRK